MQWAIQSNHSELYLPFDGANTLKRTNSPSQNVTVNPTSSFLRVEHHTLTCLPRTGTIVFAVRSYLTPLTQIRSEGAGPALADACESMPEKFGVYKNRPTWGPVLCSWLRGERAKAKAHDSESLPTAPTATAACPHSKASVSEGGQCPFAP